MSSPSAVPTSSNGITPGILFGPVLIGLVFSAMFSGMTIVQVLTFVIKGKHDPLGQKLAVWFLWLLDILHLVFMAHVVYHYLVSQPTDVLLIWSFPLNILVQLILVPVTQWFYIVRIWKITNRERRYVPVILSILVLLNLVAGIFVSANLFRCTTLEKASAVPVKPAVIFTLSMTPIIDSLVAGSLIHALSKSGTNLRWTDSSWTMLLAYLLNTGAIVSVFSLLVLITFLVSQHSLIFMAVGAVTTAFYVNSFLAMINARHYLQSHLPGPPAFVLHSETSSEHTPMDKASQRLPETINEVGLPLFEPSKAEEIRMLEVMVRQEAHSNKA